MPDESGAIDLSAVKDGDDVSKEDLEKLLNSPDFQAPPQLTELEKACAGGLRINAVPATIELEDERQFIVEDFKAWGYCPYGIFAIGHFSDTPEANEEWRVFNGDKVNNINLDFEALENAQAAAEAEQEGEEVESGDESDATESPSD